MHSTHGLADELRLGHPLGVDQGHEGAHLWVDLHQTLALQQDQAFPRRSPADPVSAANSFSESEEPGVSGRPTISRLSVSSVCSAGCAAQQPCRSRVAMLGSVMPIV